MRYQLEIGFGRVLPFLAILFLIMALALWFVGGRFIFILAAFFFSARLATTAVSAWFSNYVIFHDDRVDIRSPDTGDIRESIPYCSLVGFRELDGAVEIAYLASWHARSADVLRGVILHPESPERVAQELRRRAGTEELEPVPVTLLAGAQGHRYR